MNYYALTIPNPWPVERADIYSQVVPMPLPVTYNCIPHGISPSGEYIVGTYVDTVKGGKSRYFLYQLAPGPGIQPDPGGAIQLKYDVLPLSPESNASGRAVNDQQDVVGFLAPDNDPEAPSVAFFRTQGGLASQYALPAGVLPASAAFGLNNDRYVVGSFTQGAVFFPVPQESYVIALGSKFDGLSLGLPDGLSKEISAQLTDSVTRKPFLADYEIDAINTGADLLATATAKAAASVGGIALKSGEKLPLVGLKGPGGRKWFILRNPDQSPLPGAKGINASRQIVGFPTGGTTSFFARVTAAGVVQEFLPQDRYLPVAGTTQLFGISDLGVIVGCYNGTQPFILY